MKSTLKMILAAIGIIALSAVSKHIAALQLVEQTLAANRNILLAFIVPVVALGLILFMGGLMLMLYENPIKLACSDTLACSKAPTGGDGRRLLLKLEWSFGAVQKPGKSVGEGAPRTVPCNAELRQSPRHASSIHLSESRVARLTVAEHLR
jgi:hypothetical protein